MLPPYIALPVAVPMLLAGLLAISRATACIGQTTWRRLAGPAYFVATIVSMFSVSGTGLGYWSALGVLEDRMLLPVFFVIAGTVYTAWSAWILLHQATGALRGCLTKSH